MTINPGPPPPPIISVTGGSDGTEAHYGEMAALANRFSSVAADLLTRAGPGASVMGNGDLLESAVLAPHTFASAQTAVVMATTGPAGLTVQAASLQVASSTMLAMVGAYVTVDDIQASALEMFDYGVGFSLTAAPGITIAAGLIAYGQMSDEQRENLPETLQAWVENNPRTVEHLINGAGGLVDGLQATTSVLLGPANSRALWDHLGVSPFNPTTNDAARDIAALYDDGDPSLSDPTRDDTLLTRTPPGGIEDLMDRLNEVNNGEEGQIRIETIDGPEGRRHVVYLPGTEPEAMGTLPGQEDATIRDMGANLRLMGGDQTAYGRGIVEAINRATAGEDNPHVMLVGHSQGGMTAAEIASHNGSDPSQRFTVDEVVTAGSPTAQVEHIPDHVNVLSLENKGDVVPLTDGEPNPDAPNRTTVTFDASTGNVSENHGLEYYANGGEAVDKAARAGGYDSITDSVRSASPYLSGGDTQSQSVVITRK